TNSSMVEINVLCVIDTELVKKKYPNPSKDQANPTGIVHDSEYMLVTGARGDVRGQGT
ncbi:DNA-directed RNA polymerase subunit beta, partial [Salmonella enterica]|nr:DNA-directed RNA polymerase subunit beta [Salmonella enterica]